MKKDEGFYFIPHKWLGDSTIISMDWDCRAMHLHLMSIAWQESKKGYLINDDNLLKKILSNPDKEDWDKRIKPQILKAWKTVVINENGQDINYIYQAGLLKNLDIVEKEPIKKRKGKNDDVVHYGFNLSNLLDINENQTIFYEKPTEATQEEKHSIWTIGVQLLKQNGTNEQKARGFLAKIIKEHGDKRVAAAIAQISIKQINPADVTSYLMGILRKEQDIQKTITGRGVVSI